MTIGATARQREPIDWSQLWAPGPRRVFTDDELARAGGDAPSRTLVVMVAINLALLVWPVLQAVPPEALPRVSALVMGVAVAAFTQALRLWRRPSRKALLLHSWFGLLAYWAFVFALRWRVDDPVQRRWVLGVGGAALVLCMLGFWFVTVYRAHQIEARLRELDERHRVADMARQLAAAQIQPHFLFNSLAALEHWVQAKDDRAAPMLSALTGFLRATLPLFDRRLLRLVDEAQAAERYLEVMRLRLGPRLSFSIELAPDSAEAMLPPGVLLTLVENAVEHGIVPQLSGGEIAVRARMEGHGLTLEVSDTGSGPPAEMAEGTGLTNTRARLAQAFGQRARLLLADAPDGGCLARLTIARADASAMKG